MTVGLALAGAAPAVAADNPGTGDTGFFTFRPSEGVGGTQVNVASGNALVRTRDLADGPLTYNVVVDRVYNSLAADAYGILSPRWKFDVGPETKLTVESNQDATVAGPSGYRIRFERQPDGSYVAPDDLDGALVKTVTGWTLTRTSQGDEFGFDGSGTLTWTKDAQLRDFTVQGTSAAGRTILSSYGTNSGRRVNLSYTTSGDYFVRLMDNPASGHHWYRYSNGRLSEYESPTGQVTSYGYDADGFLDEIVEPGGTTVELDVLSSGKINSITTTLPGGVPQTTSFVYTRRTYKSDVTAPDTTRRTYAYDDDWRVTRDYDPDLHPAVTAAGELAGLGNQYVGPNRTYDVTAEATQPDGSGLRRLWLSSDLGEMWHADVPCEQTPFDLVCPTTYAASRSVSFAEIAEGRRTLRAEAIDDEQNDGTSSSWDVLVDRSQPSEPGTPVLQDPNAGSVIAWAPATDPALPGAIPGSGVNSYRLRYQVNGTEWTTPVTVNGTTFEIPGVAGGDLVAVEVNAVDSVGNVGEIAAAELEIGPVPEDPCNPADPSASLPIECQDPPAGMPVDEDPDTPVQMVEETDPFARSFPARRFRLQSESEDCIAHRCWATFRNKPQSWAVGNVRLNYQDPDVQETARVSTYLTRIASGDGNVGEHWHLGGLSWASNACGWILGTTLGSGPSTGTSDACPDIDYQPHWTKWQASPYGGKIGGHTVRGNNCFNVSGAYMQIRNCTSGSKIYLKGPTEICANVFVLPDGKTTKNCRSQDVIRDLNSRSEWEGYCVNWRYVTKDRRWVMVRDTNRVDTRGVWVFIRASALDRNRANWGGMGENEHCPRD